MYLQYLLIWVTIINLLNKHSEVNVLTMIDTLFSKPAFENVLLKKLADSFWFSAQIFERFFNPEKYFHKEFDITKTDGNFSRELNILLVVNFQRHDSIYEVNNYLKTKLVFIHLKKLIFFQENHFVCVYLVGRIPALSVNMRTWARSSSNHFW